MPTSPVAETTLPAPSEPSSTLAGGPEQVEHSARALRYFAIYRLILSGLFVVLVLTDQLPPPFGNYAPKLFAWSSFGYALLSLLVGTALFTRRLAFEGQVYLQIILDTVFITLLMHASGGIDSGLGVLLIVSIAAGSMLTAGRTAGLFASLATIALLLEQTYLLLTAPEQSVSYPQTGMLGAALFATAVLAHTLAQRTRESEALARQRGIDLANMAQLTDYIIQNMRTGIVVVDLDGRIRLMNGTARSRLGVKKSGVRHLNALSSELCEQLADWRAGKVASTRVFQTEEAAQPLLPRFMPIGDSRSGATLIFLEEADEASRQVQQLKLASLGRLTASIAHEIRNPLGAISHAGELLGESPQLEPADQRLVQIILEQSRRVNIIIENVLQLGRRGNAEPEQLALNPWLERFANEFRNTTNTDVKDLFLQLPDIPLTVRFDASHLHQVLWNLCQNGLRHTPAEVHPKVEIVAAVGNDGAPIIDVRDHGPGIATDVLPHVFDPFFTTDPRGTGLGLYIARELTECNQAKLVYLPPADGGARFRLLFGD